MCARRHVLWHRFWSVVTGAEIALNCDIEGGLQIPHPNGIVIHPGVSIGPNCYICQQVTIGNRMGAPGVPTIGAGAYIGAGARIIGPVNIGEGARIGANAVVLSDVPAGATAVGVPAKVVRRRERPPQ